MVETAQQRTATRRIDMNQYLLKGEKRNESFQIKTNGQFVTINGKRRAIRYCEGETSIFKDEQNKESKQTYIWMELGSLLVNPNDKTKNLYLQTNPDFEKHYYMYDEDKESYEELAKIDLENGVRALLADLDKDQMEAVATVLFGMGIVSRWNTNKVKVELFRFLKANPDRLEQVIKDPATEMIFLTSAAIKLGVLTIPADKTSIKWADTGLEIIPIPRGVNPLQEMSTYLRTPDAITTLQAIGNKVTAKRTGIKKATNRKKK